MVDFFFFGLTMKQIRGLEADVGRKTYGRNVRAIPTCISQAPCRKEAHSNGGEFNKGLFKGILNGQSSTLGIAQQGGITTLKPEKAGHRSPDRTSRPQ